MQKKKVWVPMLYTCCHFFGIRTCGVNPSKVSMFKGGQLQLPPSFSDGVFSWRVLYFIYVFVGITAKTHTKNQARLLFKTRFGVCTSFPRYQIAKRPRNSWMQRKQKEGPTHWGGKVTCWRREVKGVFCVKKCMVGWKFWRGKKKLNHSKIQNLGLLF